MITPRGPVMTNGSGTHGHKHVKKTIAKKRAQNQPKKPKKSKAT